MPCSSTGEISIRHASITISWVAPETPRSTTANAIAFKCDSPADGSIKAITAIAAATLNWANNNHPRLRPNQDVRYGKGSQSTSGAQRNLKE